MHLHNFIEWFIQVADFIYSILLAKSEMWHHVKVLEAFKNHNSAIDRKQY